jgi:predicted AlkP superfamily pyrophosphatase or phosphodiesterase
MRPLRVIRPALATLTTALATALTATCARPRPPAAPAPDDGPYLVVLSFDGLGRTYLDRGLPLPNLERLAARGVRARALVPSFPSLTFPNHYTLMTGVRPGRHGIVYNKMWDPAARAWYSSKDSASAADARWYRAEPLWVTAEKQGVRTAVFFWPGSMAAVGGVRPSTWLRYDDTLPNEARVDSVAAWLRRPAVTRPHLVALYMASIDQVGHRRGPLSPATDSAVVAADRVLGRLLDSLAASPVGARTNVVVLSDHGMIPVRPAPVIDLSRWADLRGVRVQDNGPVLALWFDGDTARRDRVYEALRAGLATDGNRARAYRRADTPARWEVRDEPRAGDVLVVADSGWFPYPHAAPAGYAPSPGDHGWDPAAVRSLDATFVAAGPGVRPLGTVDAFENVHVYPFLAALLGVRPAPGVDGDPAVLRPLLR